VPKCGKSFLHKQVKKVNSTLHASVISTACGSCPSRWGRPARRRTPGGCRAHGLTFDAQPFSLSGRLAALPAFAARPPIGPPASSPQALGVLPTLRPGGPRARGKPPDSPVPFGSRPPCLAPGDPRTIAPRASNSSARRAVHPCPRHADRAGWRPCRRSSSPPNRTTSAPRVRLGCVRDAAGAQQKRSRSAALCRSNERR
jgi:hypothetical protein